MTQQNVKLTIALAKLDPTNDDHWTTDGQARVDVVNAILVADDGETVTRQDIIDGAPLFTRESSTEMMNESGLAGGSDESGADLIQPDETVTPPSPPIVTSPEVQQALQPTSDAAPGDLGDIPTDPSLPPLGGDTRPSAPVMAPPTLARLQLDEKHAKPNAMRVDQMDLEGSPLDVPMAELMQSVPMLEAAIAEINERSMELVKSRQQIDDLLAELFAKSELCVKRLGQIKPKDDPSHGISAYLAASQRSRAERARRARSFISSGTSVKDVRDQLRTGSMLDAAMQQRKPALGSTRPAARVPMTNE